MRAIRVRRIDTVSAHPPTVPGLRAIHVRASTYTYTAVQLYNFVCEAGARGFARARPWARDRTTRPKQARGRLAPRGTIPAGCSATSRRASNNLAPGSGLRAVPAPPSTLKPAQPALQDSARLHSGEGRSGRRGGPAGAITGGVGTESPARLRCRAGRGGGGGGLRRSRGAGRRRRDGPRRGTG